MDSFRSGRTGKKSFVHRPCVLDAPGPLVRETDILELISSGTSLSVILDALCDAIDVQIGNVASVVVLSGDREHDLDAMAQSAGDCGLYKFCWAAILSKTDDLLGVLQMHCCDPRGPTAKEFRIIERVTRLAAVAIQGQNDGDNHETLDQRRDNAVGQRAPEEISFIN